MEMFVLSKAMISSQMRRSFNKTINFLRWFHYHLYFPPLLLLFYLLNYPHLPTITHLHINLIPNRYVSALLHSFFQHLDHFLISCIICPLLLLRELINDKALYTCLKHLALSRIGVADWLPAAWTDVVDWFVLTELVETGVAKYMSAR